MDSFHRSAACGNRQGRIHACLNHIRVAAYVTIVTISWLVRWACRAGTRDVGPALAALVGSVKNIFFLTVHYFNSFFLITQQAGQQPCWVACLLVCSLVSRVQN
jgi:hypothetical protein